MACRGDSRSEGNKVGAHSRVHAVGHRKGSKQLLKTKRGLVRTVVRTELIVHVAVSAVVLVPKELTVIRGSLEPSFGVSVSDKQEFYHAARKRWYGFNPTWQIG